MSRSVKDLRELICVSRLTIRDDDDDEDLTRPFSSLSMFGEPASQNINGNAYSSSDGGDARRIDGFAVPRPPSNTRDKPKARSSRRPQSAHSKSLSENSSFNFRGGSTPLPPVGGGSRPDSSSSSGSDKSGTEEVINLDGVLQHLPEQAVTDWLQRATQQLNEITAWCSDVEHFVDFAQFWLTEFPANQRLDMYKLELGIIADELTTAFGDAYTQERVHPADIKNIISSVLKEYPAKLCTAQGPHVFLDILDILTCQTTQAYKRLLTDTKIATRNGACAQTLLAIRAFSLISVWRSVVNFYREIFKDTEGAGAAVEDTPSTKRSSSSQDQVAKERLFCAVRKGYVSVIYYFLRRGRVRTDVRDEQGRTLTFAAVLANQSHALHYLITKHKADLPVDQPGESGNTPLHTAANWNYTSCIEVLLTRGNADINITNPQCDDATPLHLAVMQGHMEASRMLVSAGANTDASMNGITPLQLAQDMGHEEIASLLEREKWTASQSDQAMDTTEITDPS